MVTLEGQTYSFDFNKDQLKIYIQQYGNKKILFDTKELDVSIHTREEQLAYINEHILPLFQQLKGDS